MLVEPAILSRQRRLDQVIGKLIEPQRIIMLDAASAHLVAVAVEEGDSELGLLEPVVILRLVKSGQRKCQHDNQTAHAERHGFGQRFDKIPASPAGDMEPVHELGEAFVKLATPGLCLVKAEVDARIEIEKEPPQPRLPGAAVLVIGEEIAQYTLGAESSSRRGGTV